METKEIKPQNFDISKANADLWAALALFQTNCPTIEKEASGKGYKYASLPALVERVKPILTESGLGFTQFLSGDANTVTCSTFVFLIGGDSHISTTWTANILDGMIWGTNQKTGDKYKIISEVQAGGSVSTYLRRYQLGAILGVVTDEDNDGNANNSGRFNTAEEREAKKPTPNKETWPKMVAIAKSGDSDKMRYVLEHNRLNQEQKSELETLFNAAKNQKN